MEPTFTVKLAQNDSSQAPSISAFGSGGELYVAYRAREKQRQSSAVWLRAFDGETGRELRQAQIEAPVVQLPREPSMLQVSSDGRLLLYVETPSVTSPNRGVYIGVVDSANFRLISSKALGTLALPNPRIFGFSTDGQSVIIGSSMQRTGSHDQPVTESVRVIQLDARDLRKVVRDESIASPFESFGYTVDATASLWFSKDSFISKSFSEYNSKKKVVVREISFDGDYGASAVLFLRESILGHPEFLSAPDQKCELFGRLGTS
jgi:hypothetical protein